MIARPVTLEPAKVQAAPPLRPGNGLLMGRNPLGSWIEGPTGGGNFSHPFTVSAPGSVARVSYGLILSTVAVEPRIGSVKISGEANTLQPVLRLSETAVNHLGESWVCVEVTPDADGKLDVENKKSTVEVVQREVPLVIEGKTGRHPLALLVRTNGLWQVFAVTMFHLRYETSLSSDGTRKHYFL